MDETYLILISLVFAGLAGFGVGAIRRRRTSRTRIPMYEKVALAAVAVVFLVGGMSFAVLMAN